MLFLDQKPVHYFATQNRNRRVPSYAQIILGKVEQLHPRVYYSQTASSIFEPLARVANVPMMLNPKVYIKVKL